MDGEQAIRSVAKMYEMRDSMRFVLGDAYPERSRQWQGYVCQYAEAHGLDMLTAAIRFAKALQDRHAPDLMVPMVMAAYLDLSEMQAAMKGA